MSNSNSIYYNFYNTKEVNIYTTYQKYYGSGSNYNTSSNNYNWVGDAPTQTTSSGSTMQHVYYGSGNYNVCTRTVG